jgi:hypothetical protein
MSTAFELKHDIIDLEARHDKLVRAIDRKHGEYDQVCADIKSATERLAKMQAEIKKVKDHFGVS